MWAVVGTMTLVEMSAFEAPVMLHQEIALLGIKLGAVFHVKRIRGSRS